MDMITRGRSTTILLCIRPFSAWWHLTEQPVDPWASMLRRHAEWGHSVNNVTKFDSNFSLTLHHLFPPYLKVIPQVQNQVCRGQQEESEERLWTPPSDCLKIHFVVPLDQFVQHFPSLATFERKLLNFVDLLRSAQPPEPRGRGATAEINVRSDDYYQ